MAGIPFSQVETILEISGMAAESATEAHFPPVLLQKMTQLFASKSCVFYSMCEDLDRQPIWDGIGFNLDPGSVKDYEVHYRAFDPCFAGLKRNATQGKPLIISTDQVVHSERRYLSSGYYRDFLLPQRIHNSIIFAVGDAQGVLGLFGFHRAAEKPLYGVDEHTKAKLLASQMAAALRLRTLANSQLRLRALVRKLMERASIPDYLVLDSEWRVIEGTGPAAQMIAPLGTTRIVDESSHHESVQLPQEIRAHFAEHAARRRLQSNMKDRVAQTCRIFEDIPGWPRVLADLLDVEPGSPLLLLAFLPRSHELVSAAKTSHFGVTPRESEVARALSRGRTNTQIADRLGISEKTVEQHLEHLYRKTDTHNRTALIYQLSE